MRTDIIKRCVAVVFSAVMMLTGSISLPAQASPETYSSTQTLDAVSEVAFCDGTNPNKVTSIGVSFMAMSAKEDAATNEGAGSEKFALISARMAGEKTAFVLQFQKPIDTGSLEYLTVGMFAGADCKIRVYDSKTTNYIEDTAQDVLTFTTWKVEKKTLVLKKYADEDGYVRNITFYIASAPTERTVLFDYYSFQEYKEATGDYVLKAGVDTRGVDRNLGPDQVPSFLLTDQAMLKTFGWDGAIYTDGSTERILKPGKYLTLNFNQVNTRYYEKIVIDFFTAPDLELTLYAYGADELTYNRENADQIITLKGGEVTQIELDAAKFADAYGYVSQVNFLLVRHSDKSDDGFQVFLGDVTFQLPREYANVSIYTEKLSGGYERNEASTTIEGLAGDKVSIEPYDAKELGLYGYEYNSGANNILSGVLQEGKIIELKLYYKLQNCKVIINNDSETLTRIEKYGTNLDLMEYRKDNMLMNIQMDGMETEDTTVSILGDCVIDITQTPGNYVFFMVDDELFATRTYTPEENAIEEPGVPLKIGYVGEWEEYELDGTDKTVHAVYTPSAAANGENSGNDGNVIVNVANKIQDMADSSVLLIVLIAFAAAVAVAGIVILLVILVRKKKIGKRQLIIGGAAVAVCCAAICCICLWDVIFPAKESGKTAEETYAFEELYTSGEEKDIKPQETITYNIDRELKDKNYIEIDVDSDVNLLGTIEYYNLADSSQTNVEEFFIEGASTEIFHQFLDNFRDNGSGKFEKHLTAITLTNVSEEDGTVTMNKVAISDRSIDLSKAELYVENEYLKVGMDLLCGGALTYLERLPYDGQTLQEILDADGNVAVGMDYGEKEGATLLSESVNLINIYDKGREIQQSFYADVNEENGYTRGNYVALNNQDWPYNPVQGGDQDNNSSQIIDYRVEGDTLYVKTRAMDWGQHNVTTKSYMENWYTLKDDMLYVKNRFIDWNGFTGESKMINNEMPAVYFAQAFHKFVTYDGTAPWTGGALDIQASLGEWAQSGGHINEHPSEGWFAWLNDSDFGIGMYIPGITTYVSGRPEVTTSASATQNNNAAKSSMLAEYRPQNTSDYTQCFVSNTSYTAPVLTTTMDQYVPLEYTYVIRVDSLESLRNGFKNLDQEGVIDNSGLKVWD